MSDPSVERDASAAASQDLSDQLNGLALSDDDAAWLADCKRALSFEKADKQAFGVVFPDWNRMKNVLAFDTTQQAGLADDAVAGCRYLADEEGYPSLRAADMWMIMCWVDSSSDYARFVRDYSGGGEAMYLIYKKDGQWQTRAL